MSDECTRPAAPKGGGEGAARRTGPRRVILHYHLFKNAGTSLDAVLKRNFPGRWRTAEFPPQGGDNSDLLSEWIASEPEAAVFSTHTGVGPVPAPDGVEVFPVVFLREPLSRIHSAYRFERTQGADTPGSRLAREHDFEGYLRERLATTDRQCRDFQTGRLAAFQPGRGDEMERALRALRTLPFVGIVERFEASLRRLADALPEGLKLVDLEVEHANRGEGRDGPSAAERALLLAANRRDALLYAIALQAHEAGLPVGTPRLRARDLPAAGAPASGAVP